MWDNGLQEGEVFSLLKESLLVLKTLSTSLQEMAQEKEDLLVMAFDQLTNKFEDMFYAAFPHGRFLPAKRGCHVVHQANCAACEVLVESSKVESCQTAKTVGPSRLYRVVFLTGPP